MIAGSDGGLQYDVRALRVSDGRVIDIVAAPEDEREGRWLPVGIQAGEAGVVP